MPSNADRVIAEARKWIGHSERKPQLDNVGTGNPPTSSLGSWIVNEAIYKYGGYSSPQPWCGCYVAFVGERAQYPAFYRTSKGGVAHGYTGTTESEARKRGWMTSRPKPGSLAIRPGKHITIVVAVHSDGSYTTVGGNESDRVSERRQTLSGYVFVTPPDLGTASGGGGAPVKMYAFSREDMALWGGWSTREARDAVMADAQADDPGAWTRAIKTTKPSPYAFESGPLLDVHGRKTWGTPRIFGGWSSKSVRDEQHAAFVAANPGVPTRIYSYTKDAPTSGPPSAPVEGDVKFT